jgi:hypothetical protein
LSRSDHIETRARQICVARGIDPDARVMSAPVGARAWSYFREFATMDVDKASRDASPQIELPL